MRQNMNIFREDLRNVVLSGGVRGGFKRGCGLGAVLLSSALLFLGLAGAGRSAPATVIAPGGGSATAMAHQPAGQPGAGPAARLSVVDLRALPPAPAAGHAGALPFHRVGGPAPSGGLPLIPGAPRLGPLPASAGVSAPMLITGFNGIDINDSAGAGASCFCVPPDGDMAAGPNHVVVGVNQSFQVFDKVGHPLTAAISYDAFFNGCGPTGLTSSDPVIAYDPAADRFTVGILRYASSNGPSYMSLAVSRFADPTLSYNRYCFEQPYMGVMALYDFPHISVGQDAIFTTGNVFPPGSQQNISARVNAYNKAMMYSGAMTATQIYSDVLQNSDLTIADTIRPALFNVGLPTPTNYFVNVSSTSPSSRVTLWRWTLPFSTNSFVQAGGVDVATFAPPVSMLQPPPGQPMPPPGYIDARTLGGMWANGTLYSTHTIGCNPGAGVTDCIQWYQLGSIDGTPTLLQQGIISGTNESRAYPNIAADQTGNVELSYAFSSLTDFIGLRHTGRLVSDPPGAMGPETQIKAGEMAEIGFDALRYGDYSGSVLDPDGVTLWHFEEYTQNIPDPGGAAGSWGTWTSASSFPPALTPTPAPTSTPGGPTPTNTPAPSATSTQPPTPTPGGPTVTPTPTNLPTAAPTNTPGGPTSTPRPPPTVTPTRTAPALTATSTATPPAPPTTTGTPPASPTTTGTPPASPTATATPCGISFSDVHMTDYFYTPVLYLACHGVISGYSDGTFKPYNNTTRSQMVKIVVFGFNKAIVTPAGGAYTFTDVPPSNNFFAVIETAAADHIVSGYNCGTAPAGPCDSLHRPWFLPYNNVTRGQLSKIDVIAAGWTLYNPPVGHFTDVPAGSTFYTVIETAYCHGVISGYSDRTFRPYNNATRGQISKIVYLSIVNPPTNCGASG
ncbi:MAG: S-layer homology domain-containing protein [Chloroflexia bacterium]